MFSASAIDPQTIQAYLETEYRVLGTFAFALQVGQISPELLAAHKQHGVDCSAFLTACNPFSQVLDGDANAARQQALANELTQDGFAYVEGIGQHPSNLWPGEESYLVFGLSLADAKALGARLEQNGFIWSGADGTPQLILLK